MNLLRQPILADAELFEELGQMLAWMKRFNAMAHGLLLVIHINSAR